MTEEKKCYCPCHVRLDEHGNEYGLPVYGHETTECPCVLAESRENE